jgi:hypothetical protein
MRVGNGVFRDLGQDGVEHGLISLDIRGFSFFA